MCYHEDWFCVRFTESLHFLVDTWPRLEGCRPFSKISSQVLFQNFLFPLNYQHLQCTYVTYRISGFGCGSEFVPGSRVQFAAWLIQHCVIRLLVQRDLCYAEGFMLHCTVVGITHQSLRAVVHSCYHAYWQLQSTLFSSLSNDIISLFGPSSHQSCSTNQCFLSSFLSLFLCCFCFWLALCNELQLTSLLTVIYSSVVCSNASRLGLFYRQLFIEYFVMQIKKVWKTRCVALPSLVAARWVGQNSCPIFFSICRQSTPN